MLLPDLISGFSPALIWSKLRTTINGMSNNVIIFDVIPRNSMHIATINRDKQFKTGITGQEVKELVEEPANKSNRARPSRATTGVPHASHEITGHREGRYEPGGAEWRPRPQAIGRRCCHPGPFRRRQNSSCQASPHQRAEIARLAQELLPTGKPLSTVFAKLLGKKSPRWPMR